MLPRTARFLTIVFMLVLMTGDLHAEIPRMLSYQGKVTDTGGNPVADGTYTMRFRVYDAATGGTVQWDSGDQSVSVSGGIFGVLLGESPQPGIASDFDTDYWIQVTFAGMDQSPRQRLASAGYAFMASGLVPGTEVSGSVTTGTSAAIKGTNVATTGTRYGVYGECAAPGGRGVYGSATSTSGVTHGVSGRSVSTEGRGVYGYASASSGTTFGGRFESASTGGVGLYGRATASSGTTFGGWFESASSSGRGVHGQATGAGLGATYGGHFVSTSPSGRGVYAQGQQFGVEGLALGESGGVYGGWFRSCSSSGVGVYGDASATTGATAGGYFESVSSFDWSSGVLGWATATAGRVHGVYGRTYSTQGYGVYGWASATSGTTIGVYGQANSPSGSGVYYSGGLAGTGTKSCVVRTSQGPTLMYCQESPANWFEDFGEGSLSGGQCRIELDPLFLETITVSEASPMKVFIQLRDDCRGAFVHTDETGFEVVELQAGKSNARFAYRVVAKRRGFEARRLDYCKAGETDPFLFPELREHEAEEVPIDISPVPDTHEATSAPIDEGRMQ